MDKKDVIEFFDNRAAGWDETVIKNESVIREILVNGGIKEGVEVLDVACGTGVLFPYYLSENVGSVTAIDISSEMANIAKEKTKGTNIEVLCGDVEETHFGKKFDCCMVYNAFPHFPDPKNLIRVLADTLKTGGRLSIAHGASRAVIDGRHTGSAHKISVGLMHEKDLAELFEPYFEVDVVISDEKMYQVSGVKR